MSRFALALATLLLSAGLARSLEAQKYAAPPGAPYRAIDVSVPTPGGHTLAGTLTIPLRASSSRPVGAVVTSTGSGPQDRDEGMDLSPGRRYVIFRNLADSLARRGIAVLRMDDRGVGGSTGEFKVSTTADFADDVRAGLAYLRTRPDIDASRLSVVGHSEGGFVAPLVALREGAALHSIVILAGGAMPIRPILKFQLENWIRHDSTLKGARLDSAMGTVQATIDSLQRNDPWYAFIMDYDPVATLRQVRIPVLILTGGTDQQAVPENAPRIAAALVEGGNHDVTMRIYPDLNHLFINDTSGFPGGYARLEPNVEPSVIGAVADWLSLQFRRKQSR